MKEEDLDGGVEIGILDFFEEAINSGDATIEEERIHLALVVSTLVVREVHVTRSEEKVYRPSSVLYCVH